jgi:ribose transport system permease protein
VAPEQAMIDSAPAPPAGTSAAANRWLTASAWRDLIRDRPLIPLIGLLAVLVAIIQLVQPGIVGPSWAGVITRAAVPLAILAACQTLTMLTGGIDLSVGAVASMTGFVIATFVNTAGGVPLGIAVALTAAILAGLVTGVGVGVFRVHPLIMTLGMSLVVLGLANVWQLQTVQTSSGVPAGLRALGSASLLGIIPYSLIVFVPLAAVILLALRRTGYARMLYAIGDNPVAARLSGARSWQVLIVLYVISAILAAVAGLLISGLTNTASVTLADSYVLPSVAAAVIGGTSLMGGRGGFGGTIVGALILTVLTALLTVLGLPEPTRQILFGAIIVAVAAAYARVTGET